MQWDIALFLSPRIKWENLSRNLFFYKSKYFEVNEAWSLIFLILLIFLEFYVLNI